MPQSDSTTRLVPPQEIRQGHGFDAPRPLGVAVPEALGRGFRPKFFDKSLLTIQVQVLYAIRFGKVIFYLVRRLQKRVLGHPICVQPPQGDG